MKRAIMAGLLIPALLLGLLPQASAFFWNKEVGEAYVADLSKSGTVGNVISFGEEDFKVEGGKKTTLSTVVVETLPDPGAGTLLLGGTVLEVGSRVERSALSGLRFQSVGTPTVPQTAFTLRPVFSDGKQGEPFRVDLTLTEKENHPPVARNMDLST